MTAKTRNDAADDRLTLFVCGSVIGCHCDQVIRRCKAKNEALCIIKMSIAKTEHPVEQEER